MPKENKKDLLYLSLIWAACILLVNPIGDFPLNDDWAYAYSVQSLVNHNELFFHEWGAMTLLVHSLWGALFCKVFGFSFTVLRFSTLVLAWLGTLWSYQLFREVNFSRQIAFGASLVILFNPFYFLHSFSYMTDVPFYFWVIGLSYFIIKSLKENHNKYLIPIIVFSILAVLVRQIGLLFPLGYLLVIWLKDRMQTRQSLLGTLPFLFSFLSYYLLSAFRVMHWGQSPNYRSLGSLFDNIFNGTLYLSIHTYLPGYFAIFGFFLLPLLIYILYQIFHFNSRKLLLSFGVITLILSIPYWDNYNHVFIGNIFRNLSLGLTDLHYEGNPPARVGHYDWGNISLIGFIAGLGIVFSLFIKSYHAIQWIFKPTNKQSNWVMVFGLLSFFMYFIFLLLFEVHFDRYTLIGLPFLILALVPTGRTRSLPRSIKISIGISLFLLSTLVLILTKDYLSWNRARWELLKFTQEEQIDPTKVIGGFEWEGLHYEQLGGISKQKNNAPPYIITFSSSRKGEWVRSADYYRLLPPKKDSIVLRKFY